MRTRDMRIDHVTPRADWPDDLPFIVTVSRRGLHRVVRIDGELDVETRTEVHQACVEGWGNVVEVDMGDTTFMDCCGYSGLVAARLVLQRKGGSLTLRNQTGQPAALLTMLKQLEVNC